MDCTATELPLPLQNGASERCITATVQVSSFLGFGNGHTKVDMSGARLECAK